LNLYNRVRPTDFAQVVGNGEIIASLQTLTTQPDPPHAYLLTGPAGCGKTTIGRLIALSLGVNREDVLNQTGDYQELDQVRFRGIDTIREIRDGASYKALRGDRRCWLLDEVHRLPGLSQDALLKGLEDPPEHAYFVLCTTEPETLRETIRSRCSIHRVKPLSETDMIGLLHRIVSGEGQRLSRAQLCLIHAKAEGKPRAAIQLLEKVLSVGPEARDATIAEAEAIQEKSTGLARELMRQTGWKAVASVLSQIDEDEVEAVRRAVVVYCSQVLLNGENDRAMAILDQMVEPFFTSGRAGLIGACYTVCKQ
jgi:DNA polymerase-3 subunit gamma/tau